MTTRFKGFTFLLLLLCLGTGTECSFLSYFTRCPESCNCSNTSNVDCSGRGLKEIPDLSGLPIKELDMSDNLLKKFPKEISMFESLEYLNLKRNEISELSGETLRGLFNLKVLILDQNCIKNWNDIAPEKFLVPAKSLQMLSLADNPLKVNDNERNYLKSTSLTHLNLENTQLTSENVEYIFKYLPNLRNIILSNTLITEIPNTQYSEKLEYLDVSSTRITRVDWGTFNITSNLKKINLSSNPGLHLTYHNEIIYGQIIDLNMSQCGLASIVTTNFPNLESLIMKGNVIQNLSRSVFNNSWSIKTIDLSDNAIQQLYKNSFEALRELKNLDLSNNKIQNVNLEIFKENVVLNSLDLSGNPIMVVNGTTPTSLKRLNMSRSTLRHIKKQIFNNMTKLESLDLSQNFLAEFPFAIDLTGLIYLDLSSNKLSDIRWSTFQLCINLEILKLNGNRFTIPFNRNDFTKNTKLTEIYLGDNPFKCNCSDPNFKEFFYFVTEHPQKIKDKLRCDKPTGLTWETVCPNFFEKFMGYDKFDLMGFGVIILVILGTLFILFRYRKTLFCCIKIKTINRGWEKLNLKRQYSPVLDKMKRGAQHYNDFFEKN